MDLRTRLHRPVAFPGRLASTQSWFAACAGVFAVALLMGTPLSARGAPQAPVPVTAARAHGASVTTPEPVIHVLFVGASITAGMEQTSLTESFPGKVVAGLQQRGLRVDWQERARSGARVSEAVHWPYPTDQQIIVVHLITNDFGWGTPLATYQEELTEVLVDLRERSPDANLICLGTWQRPGAVNRYRVPLERYDAAAGQACARQHGNFVPLDGIFATRGSRGPVGQVTPWGPTDGYHPNDVGAQMIANAVLARIPNGD